MITLHKPVNLF